MLFATVLPQLAPAQNSAFPDTVFTNYFRRETGWTAGDATISIPLPDNRVLWLFGDSYIDHYQPADTSLPCLFQVRNAAMVQDKTNPGQMTTLLDYSQTGVDRTLFKLSAPEPPHTFFWPGHGYAHNDTVYVFLNRYHHPPGGSSTFLGTFIAKMTLPDLELVGIYPLAAMNGIVFGRWAFIPVNNPYAFIYGSKVHLVPFGNSTIQVWKPYVARIPLNNPMGQWQFRTASAWSLNPQQAVPISNYGISPGFSVIRRDNDLYLITQQNGYMQCGAGREIYTIKGGLAPWDHFSGQKKLIYTVPDQYDGYYLTTYNASIHPEWNSAGGLLISYNVNDPSDTTKFKNCPFQCLYGNSRNADTYRPKFIRLPWSVLTANGFSRYNANDISTELETGSFGSQNLTVQFYPNPAAYNLNVTVAGAIPQVCHVQILDLTGRQVLHTAEALSGDEQLFSLEIAALPPGVYLVEVRTKEEVVTGKIVVCDRD